jgi:hypothetical protein
MGYKCREVTIALYRNDADLDIMKDRCWGSGALLSNWVNVRSVERGTGMGEWSTAS